VTHVSSVFYLPKKKITKPGLFLYDIVIIAGYGQTANKRRPSINIQHSMRSTTNRIHALLEAYVCASALSNV
jgi:hypothetical protein